MAVPYHSHKFAIPTACKQDILDGTATDKVAVPAALGSAAAADKQEFATALQGQKADKAVQKGELSALAFKNKASLADIDAFGARSGTSFLRGDGQWAELPVLGGVKGDQGERGADGLNGKDGISITAVRIV